MELKPRFQCRLRVQPSGRREGETLISLPTGMSFFVGTLILRHLSHTATTICSTKKPINRSLKVLYRPRTPLPFPHQGTGFVLPSEILLGDGHTKEALPCHRWCCTC